MASIVSNRPSIVSCASAHANVCARCPAAFDSQCSRSRAKPSPPCPEIQRLDHGVGQMREEHRRSRRRLRSKRGERASPDRAGRRGASAQLTPMPMIARHHAAHAVDRRRRRRLEQNPRQLGAVEQNVIRPFQARSDRRLPSPRSTRSIDATPATKPSCGAIRDVATSLDDEDSHKDCLAANSHLRPNRPRPWICCSATIHNGPRSPARTSRLASSLVESIRRGRQAARRASARCVQAPRSARSCSKERFGGGGGRVHHRRRIDPEVKSSNVEDGKHGAQRQRRLIERWRRIVEIHHLDDAQIVEGARPRSPARR